MRGNESMSARPRSGPRMKAGFETASPRVPSGDQIVTLRLASVGDRVRGSRMCPYRLPLIVRKLA